MSEEPVTSTQIRDTLCEIIGTKSIDFYHQNIQIEVKPDKYEPRFLVATEHKLYIIRSKPVKLDFTIHLADITSIQCHELNKLSLSTDNRQIRIVATGNASFNDVLTRIFEFCAIINHSTSLDKRTPKLDVSSSVREILIDALLLPNKLPHLISPCGNFSTVYKSKCDQISLDRHEDVAWDVDVIYNSQNCTELNLSDFDHLTSKHLIPILSSLEHNRWFTKLNLSNIKWTTDIQQELLKVLKENTTLQEINLSNTGIKSDFLSKMCSTLSSVSCCAISSFDLSCNNLEDKGILALSTYISNHREGMRSLNLSKTSMTSQGASYLAKALASQQANLSTLSCLDFSGNTIKEEFVALQNFLAQPNQLRELKLADTETPLDNFFGASLRGCTQYLNVLDLSGCQLSSGGKKSSSGVQITWKQFFSSVSSLKSVNLSNNKLPPEAYKFVFEGLEENTVLSDIELNFGSCQIGSSQVVMQVFEQSLPLMTKVSSLDLSDNGFDQSLACILSKLVQNKYLKKLSIGRNLVNVKPKFIHQIMDSLVTVIQEEGSALESLNMDNMKLRGDLMVLINALGTNVSLTHLDISGNMIGDFGAKMLSKALQINRKISSLVVDNNQLSHVGLEHLATSLERNATLKSLPLPLNDIIPALKLNPDRTEKAVRKIESYVGRNSANKQLWYFEPTYRLQQWIFNNYDQEAFNRNLMELSQVIDIISSLKSKGATLDEQVDEKFRTCQMILYEAKNIKNVMVELHQFFIKEVKGGKFMSDSCDTFVDKVKECMKNLTGHIKDHYQQSIKSISIKNLFSPTLSSREEMELEKDLKDELNIVTATLFGSLFFEKSLKFAEFVLSSVNSSVEQALVNSKVISSKLTSQMMESGKIKDSDLRCKQIRSALKNDDKDTNEAADGNANEIKKTSIKRSRVRPTSSIIKSDDPLVIVQRSESQSDSLSAEQPPTTTQPKQSNDGLELLSESSDVDGFTPKLTHLCKDRPKRPKSKAPTWPTVKLEENDESDVFTTQGTPDDDDDGKNENDEKNVAAAADGLCDVTHAIKRQKKDNSKGGITTGLKNFFSKKSPSTDLSSPISSPPSEPQYPPKNLASSLKSTDATSSCTETSCKLPAPTPSIPKQPDFATHLPGAAPRKKVFDDVAVVSSETTETTTKPTVVGKSATPGQTTTAATPVISGAGNGASNSAPAPVPLKRGLPPGARPGFGQAGFAMPSANEIQLKRLSMRPISAENQGESSIEDKRPSATGSTNEAPGDSQLLQKGKPPPPLAPKPNKGFRNSKQSCESVSEQENIGDTNEKNAKEGEKDKDQDSDNKGTASFMEEFRKKQERNKVVDSSKM